MEKNKSIEKQIRDAFKCTLALDSLKEVEYEELNHKIVRYDFDSVKKYLPLLLIHEIYKDEKYIFSGTGDQLIYFLDGELLEEKAGIKNKGDSKSYNFSKTYNQNLFNKFNSDEATAVLSWLESVALPKYKDLCEGEIESAIVFWRKKVESSS
jgi:hypothetical protein